MHKRRWEIPDGQMDAPARVMLAAACGWDSRLHTDPGKNGVKPTVG
jgi:hypothetical protein